MNFNEVYLTVPISKRHYSTNISEIAINDSKWKNKHIKTLRQAYSRSDYAKEYIPELEQIIADNNNLSHLNSEIIIWLCHKFKISSEFVFSSKMKNNKELSKTDLLVDICCRLEASKYISGIGAKNYLQTEKFANIDVVWQDFTHPQYKQRSKSFIKNLSALDLLFNEGPNSGRFFNNQ